MRLLTSRLNSCGEYAHEAYARGRNVGRAGSLRGGWLPPLSRASAAVGRLTIGRSLPSRPTSVPACLCHAALGFSRRLGLGNGTCCYTTLKPSTLCVERCFSSTRRRAI